MCLTALKFDMFWKSDNIMIVKVKLVKWYQLAGSNPGYGWIEFSGVGEWKRTVWLG